MRVKLNFRFAMAYGAALGFCLGLAIMAMLSGLLAWWQGLIALAVAFLLPRLFWLLMTKGSLTKLNDEDRRLVAYHEAGHAVVAWFTPCWPDIVKVELTPRSMLTGGHLISSAWGRQIELKQDLLARIRVSLGGRAAEELCLGTASVGASGDLERVAAVARQMAKDYAMACELPRRAYPGKLAPRTEERIDQAADRLTEGCWLEVQGLVKEKRDLIENLAQALLKQDCLTGAELAVLLGPRPEPPIGG